MQEAVTVWVAYDTTFLRIAVGLQSNSAMRNLKQDNRGISVTEKGIHSWGMNKIHRLQLTGRNVWFPEKQKPL